MTKKNRTASPKETASFFCSAKRVIAILTIITASILFYGLFVYADEESPLTSVTIIDGEHQFEVETVGQTVGDALQVADITLNEGDTLSKTESDAISDGDVIYVNRSNVIYLILSGYTHTLYTNATTIEDALIANGYQIGKYDEVTPDIHSLVENGMTVLVTRVSVSIHEVEETVAYATKTVENPEKEEGYEAVTQEGKNGVRTRTFKTISKDGAGITATLIGDSITTAPVEKIVEVGTKKKTVAPGVSAPEEGMHATPGKTSDGIPYSAMPTMKQNNSVTVINGNVATTAYGTFTFSKRIPCKATAYEGSAASNGKWAGQTATGRAPVYGVVAVDPSVIPLNSKLYIESADGGKSWIYGFAVAGDTGGAIKGKRVDLCYNTLDQCYQFGRRDCIVYVLN